MYTLVFITLTLVPGVPPNVAIEHYPSMKACEDERVRIMYEMEKAYPGDKSWTLECRLTGQGI